MQDRLRIALAQFNPRMAAIESNASRLRVLRAEAAAAGADLLLTPEHALSGAVPRAIAADPSFTTACEAAVAAIADEPGPAMTIGAPRRDGTRLHDSVALLAFGRIAARRDVHHPRPGFDPGPAPGPVSLGNLRLGLMPGRDWRDPAVPETLAETGAEILLALDSLPHETGGEERVLQAALARVVENGLPLVLLNRLGAEGESAHDGGALVLNADRTPALRLPPFGEGLTITEWAQDGGGWHCLPRPSPAAAPAPALLWQALVLALRDHRERLRPAPILLPITDDPASALTAALAIDAYPSDVTRGLLLGDAGAPLARRLGIGASPLNLDAILTELSDAVPPATPHLQGRLHRITVDALAEAGAAILLTTGPSDHPGAFFPLKYVPPPLRHALAAWRNAHRPAGLYGPEAPDLPLPSGAARPKAATEPGLTPWQSLLRADYKRRQLPPGLNIAPRAFGQPQTREASAS